MRTFFDFDDMVTAPLFGYKSALDYYNHCSSKGFIYNIQTPGIIVHAEDDPIVPPSELSKIDWKKLPNLTNLVTPNGGHVGFISEPSEEIPDGRWLSVILLDYFDTQLNS